MAKVVRIISGGQTGADRAALDTALSTGIEHGGWCPRGRRAEDGPIPLCYQLTETAETRYEERTKRNVMDSDATLIVTVGRPSGGTALTAGVARRHKKPLLVIDSAATQASDAAALVAAFVAEHHVGTLNVAGPRASSQPTIYGSVCDILSLALKGSGR